MKYKILMMSALSVALLGWSLPTRADEADDLLKQLQANVDKAKANQTVLEKVTAPKPVIQATTTVNNPFSSITSSIGNATSSIGQVGAAAQTVKNIPNILTANTASGVKNAINTNVMSTLNTSFSGVITVNPGGTTGTSPITNLGGLTGQLAQLGNGVESSLQGSSSGSSAIRAGFVENFSAAGKLGSAPQTNIATGGPWGGKLFTVTTSGGGLFGGLGGLLGGLNLGNLSSIAGILANPTGALTSLAANAAQGAINNVVGQATGALNNAVGGVVGQVGGVLNTANQIGGIASSISSGNLSGVANQLGNQVLANSGVGQLAGQVQNIGNIASGISQNGISSTLSGSATNYASNYANQVLSNSGVGQTIGQINNTIGQVQNTASTISNTVSGAQSAFANYRANATQAITTEQQLQNSGMLASQTKI